MCHPKGRSAAKDARSALTRRPARSYSAPTIPATVRYARRRSGERHERSIPRPPALPAPLADPPIAPQPTHTRLRRAIYPGCFLSGYSFRAVARPAAPPACPADPNVPFVSDSRQGRFSQAVRALPGFCASGCACGQLRRLRSCSAVRVFPWHLASLGVFSFTVFGLRLGRELPVAVVVQDMDAHGCDELQSDSFCVFSARHAWMRLTVVFPTGGPVVISRFASVSTSLSSSGR